MKLLVKNKMMTFTGSSNVFDENNNPAFIVKGTFMDLLFNTKKVTSLTGNLLYTVTRRPFYFLRTEDIKDSSGKVVCTIKKEFNLTHSFQITGTDSDMRIDGDFFGTECKVIRNGVVIGVISRQFFQFSDTFTIDANDDEDPALLVAIVIAIDCIFDDLSSHH